MKSNYLKMSNLEKIQKGMRVLQILSKIVLVCAIVGVALTSIAAVLVTADVLNMKTSFSISCRLRLK